MRRDHPTRYALALLMIAILALAAGAEPDPPSPPKAKPCTAPEYRQFDFWIGEWDVQSTAGGSGVNRITRICDGCALREEYQSTRGPYAGTSLNFYDAKSGQWYQTWIDNQGAPLLLSGGLEGGSMVLASDPATPPIQRITWSQLGDGRVRQLWESSADGQEWKVVFDGTYTRKPAGKRD